MIRHALLACAALAGPAALAQGEQSPPDFDHELTVWAIPAPRPLGLTWRRPGPLTRRTLIHEGFGFDRGIGHAGVRVECAATAQRPAAHFQGSMTTTGDAFRPMVLEEKAGLGTLFRTVPGRLEREEELGASLDERYESGRVAWVRYGISAETCHALLDYAEEFEARQVDAAYGFVRPLYQEGAGCSAFSMSFLRLADLVEPDMEREWTFDVRVPLALVGGETNPERRVGLLRLLFVSRRWAAEDEPHLRLTGWDPTAMYRELRARAERPGEVVERRGRAVGVVLDRRQVLPTEALRTGTFFAGAPELDSEARFLTAQ